MITKKKLDIFIKYNGDGDMLILCGTQKEKSLIDDDDWRTIASLIQDIQLVDRSLASQDYKQRVLADIEQKISIDAIDTFYDLSRRK